MGDHSAPERADRDALQRAARTFAQGLAVVVVGAASAALTAAVAGGVEWTRAYWVAVGLACAQAAVSAGASYVHRRFGSDPAA